MKKRLLSLLLVIVMVLGMVPTSVFAVEGVPFVATVDGEEMTQIEESTIDWPDWFGGVSALACYTVTIPQGAETVTLDFESEMQWTYYDVAGNYIGEGPTSWESSYSHEITVQDSNGDGEIDGVSAQDPATYSAAFYIQFVYGTAACLTVKDDAPAAATAKSGGLYQLAMSDVFAETEGHEVTYSYTFNSTADPMFTKLQDGVLYLTPTTESPEDQPYDLVLTARCEGGEVSHTVKLTVDPPNEGIAQQYGYDETDKSSVTVYVTISNDGMPLLAGDKVLANMEVTVPYFELSLYGLEQYNRYGTDGGRGPYVNDTVIKRPTGLHLYIYLLERYYMGLPEEQCCTGESGVLEYAQQHEIVYMDGSEAYNTGNNRALVYSGGATSIFMNEFWGHDCNLMYYRNHCYPYMSPGWGSTSDYILLSDGDAIDVAMFTNWGFYHSGYFASFDQDVYEVAEGGSTLTVKTQQWGTSAAAESFVPVNGSEGMQAILYNGDWEELYTLNYDSDDANTITVDVPEEEGIYYLLAMDPNAADKEEAKIAPAVARIVVGEQSTGADLGSYYEGCEFLNIKDDLDRYLVDITPGELETEYYGTIPIYQIIVEEGTETVYVTFEPGTEFSEWVASYDVESHSSDYAWDNVSFEENEDGTVTVAIPITNYTGTGAGIILEDSGNAWLYGFDFVTGTITKVQAGTAVSRILLNSYKEHLWIGDSVTLIPTVMPAEATGWTIQWTSSDEDVATVDQNGTITATGDGTAIITAAIGDVKVQCTVTSEQYNTAPSVVSGTPSWKQVETDQTVTMDISGWFTDEEQTGLSFTAEIRKATKYNASQYYDYGAAGPQVTVNGSVISFTAPEVGIYALNVTASDGKLTTTHSCQLTVAAQGVGTFKVCDGITLTIHNVAPVGYSVDGNTHYVVLSKNTIIHNSWIQPLRCAGVTAEPGYSCGQNYASEDKTELQVGAGASMNVHVKDPDGKTASYVVKFYTECSGEHTDGDADFRCDKCTLSMPPAGEFAFMAVGTNGMIVEPCYISYTAGATVKDALKGSGHEFEGIDSGFIAAIDGVVDNFSLHYDGDGFSLDTPASQVTGLWFTTNSSQAYTEDQLNLTKLMAQFNTSTSGVKDYAAAKTAYDKAVSDFIKTGTATTLYTNLKAAMDAYDRFATLEKVPVTLNITQAEQKLESGKAVFTSQFNTEHTFTEFADVRLAPAEYQFDISDGSFRHVRGSITVTEEGATLTTSVSTGKWIDSLWISDTSGKGEARRIPESDVTDDSGIFYLMDNKGPNLFPYITPAEGVDTDNCKIFARGYEYARTWQATASSVTAAASGLKSNSLEGGQVVFEARMTDGDYVQYQTFTATIVRVPTLRNMELTGEGTKLNSSFDKEVNAYTVNTTADSMDVATTPWCEGVSVTVNGVAGTDVNVPLKEIGTHTVTVTVSAPGCKDNIYTVTVNKLEAVDVTLTHDEDVSVQVVSNAGALIAPVSSESGADLYKLVPGESYTWTSAKNTYYHATAAFTAEAGKTVAVATPKTEDWGTNIAARTTSNANSELTIDSAFTPADHEYTFRLESNTAAIRLLAGCANYTNYPVTIYYQYHKNHSKSPIATDPDNFDDTYYTKSVTSKTTYNTLSNAMKQGGFGNEFRIEYKQKNAENGVTYYQDYFVYVERDMTLNALSAADADGNAMTLTQTGTETTGYTKLVKNYTTQLASGMQEMALTLKPVSTSCNYDFGFTVTVTNGDWSQTLVFGSTDVQPSKAQTVTVPLNGTTDAENITITVEHTDPTAQSGVYTLAVEKLPPVVTAFATTPVDATIFLTDDSSGVRMLPNADGTFTLNTAASYTYVITANGYVAQTGSFVASEETKVMNIDLDKAPVSTLKDITAEGDWLQFRADENNNGVVDLKTPIKAEDAVLEWANQIGEGYDSGATGCPIIVGGYLYTYAGEAIHKINKDTGEVVDRGTMVASSSFAINSPTYADGMIFVGLSGGRVQAFNAETLESLWVFTDVKGGQPNCPIVYCDGYIYTGFWNSETKQANFVCLSVTDEDTTKTTESKLPTWTYTHNGFYWAGAYACEDFVLIGTDDGDSGYTKGYASILSLDPKTGVLLDEEKLTNVGDQRSSICYDAATDAYYFTTKGGDFYQVKVEADGTFKEKSLRRLHLDNGSDDAATPPMSTSTPVIYNGRAYIGVSGIDQFGAYSGHNMTVIDLESFSIAYSVPTMGYPQTSGLLTTGYEDTDGYVYVYFIDNYTPGVLRVLRDKKGMTEVDHTYTSMESYTVNGEEKTIEAGYVLYTPYGDEAQYAICSPIADSEGNLYFKNDTARMMRLSSRMTSLEIVQQPEKQVYCVGNTFDGAGMQVIAHYANDTSRDVTNYISYTTDPLTADDAEITVSFAPDMMFENTEDTAEIKKTPAGGYWQWYQDVDGKAGQTYYLPTATVTIDLRAEHTVTYANITDDTHDIVCGTCGETTAAGVAHEYDSETGECPCGAADPDYEGPEVTGSIRLASAALDLKDKVSVIYRTTDDTIPTDEADVEERGVLLYDSAEKAATKDPAQAVETVILTKEGDTGKYKGQSEGIDARDMDKSKFAVAYLKLKNGEYIFGTKDGEAQDPIEYSPLIYCQKKQNDSKVGTLCCAIMQYGAAAQAEQYGMTTGLMDEGFEAVAYDAAVLGTEVFSVDTTETNGMTLKSAALDLKGAISYIIRFTANESLSGKQLYAEYSLLGETGSVELVPDGNRLKATISGIPAKDMGATLKVKAYYLDENGEKVYGAELVYSGYEYVRRTLNNASSTETTKTLAEALAMYIYLANQYANQ